MKQILITATLIITFAFTLNANAAFDKREDRINSHRENRIAPPGDDNNSSNQTGAPIGDAIPFLIGLVLIYGIKKALEKKAIHNS